MLATRRRSLGAAMDVTGYTAPTTLAEAITLLGDPRRPARPLSGGTDLIVQLRASRSVPTLLVDVKRIPELRVLQKEGTLWQVGAAVPVMDIADHPTLGTDLPALADAAQLIGSPQTRNRATLGGNVGNASPAADGLCALVASSALCEVAGVAGRRTVAVEGLLSGPGVTTLAPGELIIAFWIESLPDRSGAAYLRFTPRSEMDIAVVGAGVSLTLDDEGVCIAARVVLAAVAPTPLVVADAAEALVGSRIDQRSAEIAAVAASAAGTPIDDKRGTASFRRHVAGVLVRRAVIKAAGRAEGGSG